MSIAPILAVAEIRAALEQRTVPCVAVSPLSAATPSKAPPTGCSRGSPAERRPRTLPRCYAGLIDALVVDEADEADAAELPEAVRTVVTQTLMSDLDAARRLRPPRSTRPARSA